MPDLCTPCNCRPLDGGAGPRPHRLAFPALLFGLLVTALAAATPSARAASEPFDLESGQVCLDCHDELNKQQVIHPATEEGAGCATLCHQQDDPARHQFAALPAPLGPLCMECHDQVVTQGDTHQHPPVEDGDCTSCHDPHQSDQAKLLNAAYPATFYQAYSEAAYGLCLNCHEAETFNEPRTETATAFRNGDLNLHQRHVNKDKGRSCRTCHSPHSSQQPHLIISSFLFGERRLGITYETTDNGGSCVTSCHIKAVYDRLVPVKNELRTSPSPGQDAGPQK